jgi:hypothetical protein
MHPDSPTVLDVPKPTLYKHPYKGKKQKHKKKTKKPGCNRREGLQGKNQVLKCSSEVATS